MSQPFPNASPEQIQALIQGLGQTHGPQNMSGQSHSTPSANIASLVAQVQMGVMQQAQQAATAAMLYPMLSLPFGYQNSMALSPQTNQTSSQTSFTAAEVDILADAIHQKEGTDNIDKILWDVAAVTKHTFTEWKSYYIENSKDIEARNTSKSRPDTGSSSLPRAPSNSGKARRPVPKITITETIDLSASTSEDSEISDTGEPNESLDSSDEELPTQAMLRGRQTGQKSYFPAEKRALAKFIARVGVRKWLESTKTVIIRDFQSQLKGALQGHPHRSDNAWLEYWRAHESELKDMAKRFADREVKRKRAGWQRARGRKPSSLGKQRDRRGQPSASKRKCEDSDCDDNEGQHTRRKLRWQ